MQSLVLKIIERGRIILSRIVIAIFFVLILLSQHRWQEGGLADMFLELSSVIFIFVGTYGRLWCTLFISGYKTTFLIFEGPYSISRHPLYFFSFIALIGVCLETEMLTFVAAAVLLFAIFYPVVIRIEEEKLQKLHGTAFDEYKKRVPAFFPNFKLYKEPETYVFNTRLYRKAFLDGIWFVLLYPVLEIIEHLHESGVLPVVFRFW